MKLTAKVKLKLNPAQHETLPCTMRTANAACNWISEHAFSSKMFNKYRIQKQVYKQVREKFNLSAQLVIRCIAKVADSYKISTKKQRGFKQYGAIAYDSRILSWKMEKQTVSIWSTSGRLKIGFECGERDRELLQAKLAGVPVVPVNPAYSSQTCSKCGYCAKQNRLSQSSFKCRQCAYVAHADLNASRNIATWATRNAAVQINPLEG